MENNVIKYIVFDDWGKIGMSQEEKLRELQELTEHQFRTEVILPLFRKISTMKHVQDRHGNDESGLDIAFFEEDSLGTLNMIGVQLKVGNIANTPSSPNNNDITTICTQIKAAFERRHNFVEPRGKYEPKSMYVITSGRISNSAQNQIVDSVGIHNQINFLNGEEIINLLERHYPDYFIIKDKQYIDYYRHIYEKHNNFSDLKKFGTAKEKSLKEIFVEPDISKYEDEKFKKLQNSKEEKINCKHIINNRGYYLILGEQGIGKTTLLKALLCWQIRNNLDDKEKGKIPVLIKIKDLIDCDFDIIKTISYILDSNNGERILSELNEDLNDGNYLLLIDSYNEIFLEEQIQKFENKLYEFIKSYPNNSIVLTSRKYKLTLNNKFEDFDRYEIQEFNHDKLNLFIKRWYNGSELLPDVAYNAVERKISIGNFPRTPFVYTICMVLYEHNREEITSNVAELFEKFIELYLGKWDKELGIKNLFDYKTKHDYLSYIAYYMHKNSMNSITRDKFIELVNARFKKVGLDEEGDLLLNEILNSGIIREFDDRVEFAFFTLLEFFCSKYILLENLETELLANYNDSSWAYVMIYYSGLKRECNIVIKNILANNIDKKENSYEAYYMTFLLGTMMQNADQTDEDIKIDSLKFCLNELIGLHYRVLDEEANNDKIREPIMVLLFIDAIATYILSSPKLKNQYYKLFSEYSSTDEEYNMIWKFLLSSIISELALKQYPYYIQEVAKYEDYNILISLYLKTKHFMKDRNSSLEYSEIKTINKKLEKRLKSSKKSLKNQYKYLLG